MSTAVTTPMVNPPVALKIFGREPAAWIGLIEGILTLLMAFAIGVSQETFGPIMAVVVALGGAYTAWATRDTMLGAVTGLAKSLLVLLAVYGLTLTDQQTAAIMGAVSLVVGFWQRTQTSPTIDPTSPSPQQVVEVGPNHRL